MIKSGSTMYYYEKYIKNDNETYLKYLRSCVSVRDSLINLPGTAFSLATTRLDLSFVVKMQYFLSFYTQPNELIPENDPYLLVGIPLLLLFLPCDPLEDDLLPELSLAVCLIDA